MVYVGRSCPEVPGLQQVVWPRPSAAALQASVPEIADSTLACFAAKLRDATPVRIVFFGSSVTAGIRCKHKKERSVNFPQQLVQLLEHRFPRTNVSIDVYGYPGASPSFMTACASTLMRTDDADLYVLEMTDNLSDGYHAVGKSIEKLMASIRERAPSAALMLLAPIPQRCVRSLKRMKPFQHVGLDDASTFGLLRRDCYSNYSVAASFEDVGTAHNLTTVSARNLIRDELWRNPSKAGRIIGRLHYDAVHPSGAGHWQLAVALEYALTQQLSRSSNAAASVCLPPQPGSIVASNVFAPRTPYSGKQLVCAMGTDLQKHVLRSSGWRYAVERNSQGLEKPGYVADIPGATLDLCHRPELRTEQAGSAQNRNSLRVQVAWSLGYLMSYEHMGQMRGECLHSRSSCTCGAREFNGHWRLPVSQPHISRLKLQIRYSRRTTGGPFVPEFAADASAAHAAAACPCVIRLTLLNKTDSGEHKFKLVSLMSGFYTGTIVSDAVGWAARYGIM